MHDKRIEQLFVIQRDATIGVVNGIIAFLNPAAQTYYPDISPGNPANILLPSELLERAEETFSASLEICEEPCTVLAARMDDMRLFTLVPEAKPGAEEGYLLENVCGNMRRTLTVLNMATELLTPAIDRLEDAKQRSNLTIINKSYYKLQRLCDNLDSLVRFSGGQGRLQLEQVDFVRFCHDLVQSVGHFAAMLGHKLTFQSAQDQWITALDRPKMSKLLLNLISNSLKRLGPDGKLHLDLAGTGDDVILSLRDTGAGIPARELAYVFEQYQRERSDTDPLAGVGAGMSVAREIAKLHGGTLLVTSNEGKGTTVSLRLPRRRMETDGLLQASQLPYGAGDDGMHMILTELADVLGDAVFGRKYRD
ncbi:MAG: HAMP domain-containing histidine kinase [Oscillospiraceae bacterium]|nr:HAMP domain-containing histidine kinase [Oscillospiraceae bacterium]